MVRGQEVRAQIFGSLVGFAAGSLIAVRLGSRRFGHGMPSLFGDAVWLASSMMDRRPIAP
jgi:hypothetical protein